MKHATAVLVLLAAALGAAPILAAPLDGKQAPPPKQEKKKDAPKPVDKKPVEATAKVVAIGTEIDPATSLSDCAGKEYTFKQYRGHIVVLDFWSTSSAKSAQTARLAKIAQDYASKNVTVLGVNPVPGESNDAKTVLEALKKSGATFPVLLDDGAILAERLGAHALEQVFVLDAKGVVRYTGAIDDDPKGEKADKAEVYLTAALDSLIAGKEVATPTTTANGGALRLPKRKPAASGGAKH
jgi:peroxiredoxin